MDSRRFSETDEATIRVSPPDHSELAGAFRSWAGEEAGLRVYFTPDVLIGIDAPARRGYLYDDGQWKTKTVSIAAGNGNPCDTNPWLPECNPCPPPQISCSLQPLFEVPTVYSLAQDRPIPKDAPSLDAYRTGLRRVESIGPLRLSGIGSPDTRSTAEDARVNGITGVRFGVPRPSAPSASAKQERRTRAQERVRIQVLIYDTGGRLVRTAVSEDLDPGFYQYQWDVRSDRGERVAPGVYVLVMNAPGFAKSSKLIVTR